MICFGSDSALLTYEQGKDLSNKPVTSTTDFTAGLSILLLAQILSAYMGVYVQDTYAEHGANWRENLFYSHFLSLPMFLPLTPILRRQYTRLSSTPTLGGALGDSPNFPHPSLQVLERIPVGLLLVGANALTQLACISGVNLLSATSSAVTVTIVLNIRKLVSFVLSTMLFGHSLSAMMVLGSALVFGSGALYGYETSWRIPSMKRAEQQRLKGGKK